MGLRTRKPLQERVDALKTRPDRRYYALGLRDDLAQLIAEGLAKTGLNQRKLTQIAGYKNESYMSRLVNAATDFKVGVAARVLVPMGIIPTLVDRAELDRLREIESRQSASTSALTGSQDRVISAAVVASTIPLARFGTQVFSESQIGTKVVWQPRSADDVDRPRSMHSRQVKGYGSGTGGRDEFLPRVRVHS